MFSRKGDEHVNETHEMHHHTGALPVESRTATVARGGLSFWSILTGVLVAFGVMFLLSAIAGAVIVNTGLENDLADGSVVEVGIGAIAALAIAQFLSYLWGGYTAGRMARGSGLANGLLVPITALVIAGIIAGITYALGESTSLGLPFAENRLPTNNDALIDLGVAGGIASLVAMLLGGLLGGMMGHHWHTKLERRAIADHDAKTIDIREGRTTTTTDHEHTQQHVPATTGGSHDAPTTANEAAAADHREPMHTRPAGESTRTER
jgi:hypothetical protein